MPENDAPHTDGGESGQAGPYGGTGDKDKYDKWYGVGQKIEKAKGDGKSY